LAILLTSTSSDAISGGKEGRRRIQAKKLNRTKTTGTKTRRVCLEQGGQICMKTDLEARVTEVAITGFGFLSKEASRQEEQN
jgi:hypothetical protein